MQINYNKVKYNWYLLKVYKENKNYLKIITNQTSYWSALNRVVSMYADHPRNG